MRLKRIPASHEVEAAALAGARFFGGLALHEGAEPGAYLARGEDEPASGFAPADWLDEPQALLTEILALHQVPAPLAERIVLAAMHDGCAAVGDPVATLAAGLAASLPFGRLAGAGRRGRVALVGPPGAGKTILAAKLAARARIRPLLLDAAHDGRGQLGDYAEALGAVLRPLGDAASLADIRRPAIIDTAGVNPRDGEALRGTAELLRAMAAEPILVLPADLGAADASAATRAFAAIGVHRLVVTRLDMVRRLGGALAAAASGCTLIGASVTPHFAYGLRPLSPIVLARRLLSAAIGGRRWQVG